MERNTNNVGRMVELSNVYYFKPRPKVKNESRKFAWLFALLFFVFFGTTISYTYWDDNINPINNTELNIGVGATLTVTETIGPDSGQYLVPEGVFMGVGDVTEIIFGYTAVLNKIGSLNVIVKDILINGQADPYGLLVLDVYETAPNNVANLTLSKDLTVINQDGEYTADLYVRITLIEPADETQYNFVAGQPISFTLECAATEYEGS